MSEIKPRSSIWTADFWAGAGERAAKSAAQSIVGLIGTESVGITDLDWAQMLSITATFTLLSVLTSIINADFTAGRK